MADRDFDRELRRHTAGYRAQREESEGREGDRSMARNYSREDMRRYGRQSQEQSERLRRLRGQGSPRSEEQGRRELYRGYGPTIAQREGRYARREGRDVDRNYDYERDYRSTPNRGRDMNLEGSENPGRYMRDPYASQRGPAENWDVQDERQWRDDRNMPSGRDFQADLDWQRTGGEYNRQRDARGSDRYDNYWGARAAQRGRQAGEAWWDTTSGRPSLTSARGAEPASPYRGEADWEGERQYDMDPGFSYEFGTDFNFLYEVDIDAERQRLHQRRDQRERQEQPRRAGQRSRQAWNTPGPYTGIGPSGYTRSDERILEEMSEIFTQHGRIDASGIDIHVNQGQVELRGEVGRREEKYLAEDIAARVMGVKDVQNNIRVQPGEGVRVRGMGRENVVMPGRIQERMRVAGVDGKHIGTVKEVHQDGFTLERSEGAESYIPFRAVKRTNGQIILHVAGNEIDRQGWKRSSS